VTHALGGAESRLRRPSSGPKPVLLEMAPAIPKMSVEISKAAAETFGWPLICLTTLKQAQPPPKCHQQQTRLLPAVRQSTQCLHSTHLSNVSQSIAQTAAVSRAGTIKPNLRSRLFTRLCDGVPVDSVAYDSDKSAERTRRPTCSMGKASRAAQRVVHQSKQNT
jgi:hypothetical protein